MRPTIIKAYEQIDENGSRYLLGDHMGHLYVVVLVFNDAGDTVMSLQLEQLGETSYASTISYLDNGYVYIGSTYGDSQLIKLHTEKKEDTYVEVIESYTNIGPIIDFLVVDLEHQGQVYLQFLTLGLSVHSLNLPLGSNHYMLRSLQRWFY